MSENVRHNSIMLSDSQINAVPYMTASRTIALAAEREGIHPLPTPCDKR